jgi:hypothetical protein
MNNTPDEPAPGPTNSASPAEPSSDHADAAPTHLETGGFAPGHRWRWKPGQSGNPAGRPRRPNPTILSDILRDGLTQPSPRVPGKSYAEVIGTLILNAAAGGNVKAINALLDRTEGRPRRIIDNTGPRPFPPEEWAKLEAALAALEPYPDARNAALRAIIEYSERGPADPSPDRLTGEIADRASDEGDR